MDHSSQEEYNRTITCCPGTQQAIEYLSTQTRMRELFSENVELRETIRCIQKLAENECQDTTQFGWLCDEVRRVCREALGRNA